MYQPASMKTFDITGSSEVILQITGIGPIKPTHAEVDIAGMPVPVGGPYPEDLVAEGEEAVTGATADDGVSLRRRRRSSPTRTIR